MNRQTTVNVILIICTIASLGASLTLARRVDAAEEQLRQLTDVPITPHTPSQRTALPMPD